jgi:hypothetical protein
MKALKLSRFKPLADIFRSMKGNMCLGIANCKVGIGIA